MKRHLRMLSIVALAVALTQPSIVRASTSNWVPRHGAEVSYTSTINGVTFRHLQQLYSWDYAYQLSELQASNVTLEVETHENCASTCWTYPPIYYSWTTNMPHGYVDISVDDDRNYPNWTVGSSDTRGMSAGTVYTTWIRVAPGGAASGHGALSFQKGHRSPSWCGLPECIFPDPNSTIYTIGGPYYSQWTLHMPTGQGGYGWQWP